MPKTGMCARGCLTARCVNTADSDAPPTTDRILHAGSAPIHSALVKNEPTEPVHFIAVRRTFSWHPQLLAHCAVQDLYSATLDALVFDVLVVFCDLTVS